MCLAPRSPDMDPTPAEGSARQTRRKHYRKKTGKNATQRGGSTLPPRHPQLKRQSQRAPNQQGSQQVGFLGSGPARQEPQRRNRRQGRRPPAVTYGKQAWQPLWWPVVMPSVGGEAPVFRELLGYSPGPGASALSLTPRFSTPGSVPPAPLNSTRLALAGTWLLLGALPTIFEQQDSAVACISQSRLLPYILTTLHLECRISQPSGHTGSGCPTLNNKWLWGGCSELLRKQ